MNEVNYWFVVHELVHEFTQINTKLHKLTRIYKIRRLYVKLGEPKFTNKPTLSLVAFK